MCRSCEICGEILVQKKEGYRWPRKCPACRKTSYLEKARVRQSRIRDAARVANLDRRGSAKCEVCSRAIEEIPRRGPLPKKCKDCKRHAELQRHEKRSEKYEKKCKRCGKAYKTRHLHQRYCSPLCGHTASRKRVAVTCCICRDEFEVLPHDAPGRKFCSRKCFVESRRRWRICEGCGQGSLGHCVESLSIKTKGSIALATATSMRDGEVVGQDASGRPRQLTARAAAQSPHLSARGASTTASLSIRLAPERRYASATGGSASSAAFNATKEGIGSTSEPARRARETPSTTTSFHCLRRTRTRAIRSTTRSACAGGATCGRATGAARR
jgi:hypothetical protein